MNGLPFRKMHGLGNDFVVLDARRQRLALTPAQIRAIGDRRRGVGFDQLLTLEPPPPGADLFLRIHNPDGSEAGACGNGTRCVAALAMAESGARSLKIATVAGLLDAQAAADGRVAVDMGPARTDWRDIPLARAMDTLHVDLAAEDLRDPVCTSMGNPHASFFVADAERVDLARLGPRLERDPLFPERANIGIVQVLARDALRVRVWERGAGITLACGSGACAALVAAARRGLSERRARVVMDGGPLEIEWRADGHVLMTGPTATSFEGRLDSNLLALA
ncbi:MAG: diaminopimelate epimerase [Alphaproteobacteria bacterium]|nr:diaminopimelate epimerase [Alphaproteobacteria bacterium]